MILSDDYLEPDSIVLTFDWQRLDDHRDRVLPRVDAVRRQRPRVGRVIDAMPESHEGYAR